MLVFIPQLTPYSPNTPSQPPSPPSYTKHTNPTHHPNKPSPILPIHNTPPCPTPTPASSHLPFYCSSRPKTPPARQTNNHQYQLSKHTAQPNCCNKSPSTSHKNQTSTKAPTPDQPKNQQCAAMLAAQQYLLKLRLHLVNPALTRIHPSAPILPTTFLDCNQQPLVCGFPSSTQHRRGQSVNCASLLALPRKTRARVVGNTKSTMLHVCVFCSGRLAGDELVGVAEGAPL